MSSVLPTILILIITLVSQRVGTALFQYGKRHVRPIKNLWSRIRWRSETTGRRKQSVATSSSRSTEFVAVNDAMQMHKDLYHRLQNLEKDPIMLPMDRDLLISFFAEALVNGHLGSNHSILTLEKFDPKAIARFLQIKDQKITVQWEQYLSRRKAGMPREMFKDREHARWWLRQSAPVKFVDGAWLGHLHKISTPFALRGITKNAWQILSEELGDGDLAKHHVHIYRKLMDQLNSGLPNGDSAEFINDCHKLNAPRVWKAAVAQLLISLFPHEFLPEILGFNMHFEMLTWDTMRAIKELKELGLDSHYFLLHVSIDNADSGHTAMAMQAVVDYVQYISNVGGDDLAQQTWRRVQTGFLLSESLVSSPGDLSGGGDYKEDVYFDKREVEIVKIFQAKATVAHRLHCSSRVKIKGRTLVEWLEPNAFVSRKWQSDFLHALADTKPWIYKGNSDKSRLVAEFCWDGKMFGSLTQTELGALRRWIDSLAFKKPDAKFYWSFVGRHEVPPDNAFKDLDIRRDYPVFSAPIKLSPQQDPLPAALVVTVPVDNPPRVQKLLACWFTQTSLLEGFSTIPFKTANRNASALVRVLRAQYGFANEGTGVAGMDETRRLGCLDIVKIGLEMMQRLGLPEPRDLKTVLERGDAEFALTMLHLSMRPIENKDILLGMAWAFLHLQEALAKTTSTRFLSAQTKSVLADMAQRERLGLEFCLEELKANRDRYARVCTGFERAKAEILEIFT